MTPRPAGAMRGGRNAMFHTPTPPFGVLPPTLRVVFSARGNPAPVLEVEFAMQSLFR